MRYTGLSVWRFLLVIGLYVFGVSAQDLYFGLNGGVSKTIGDEYSEYELGWAAGASGYFRLGANVMVGARAGYSQWDPVNSEFEDAINTPGLEEEIEIDGRAWVFELIPLLRIISETPYVKLFLQGGGGWYIINSRVTASAPALDIEEKLGEQSTSRFGIQFGGGAVIGNMRLLSIEILPLYNVVFTEDDAWNYFTLNAGIGLGF
ncbi:MAG: hypothetical protein ACOC4C_02705 [Fibrobacterota bacterium]